MAGAGSDVGAGVTSVEWFAAPAGLPPLADATHLWWNPADPDEAPAARRERVEAVMRAVLAPYLGLPADALRFAREEHGRPYLLHRGAPDFNLSDTAGGTLVAVCGAGRVGVDLERTDRVVPAVRLARRYFAAAEADALAAMDDAAACLQFVRWWTAKEAGCKATGTGLSGHMATWCFAAGDSATPEAVPDDAGDAASWQFVRIAPSPSHTAVVAWRDAPGAMATRLRGFVRD
jgi:4'-phosphopantetheinyl transferase